MKHPSPLNQRVAACLLFLFAGGGLAVHGQNTSPLDTAPGVKTGAATKPAKPPAAVPATKPASAVPAAPAETAPSLLVNGDFESASADPAWPDGWIKAKGISWETENGKRFLHLVQQQPGAMLMAYREMAVPAGVKNLEVTIRYRTAGVVAGTQNWNDARAIFHFIDASRKVLSPEPGVLIFSKDALDWTEVSEQLAVPEGATALMLIPSLCQVQEGTLDLAEIRVTAPDDGAPAAKPAAKPAATPAAPAKNTTTSQPPAAKPRPAVSAASAAPAATGKGSSLLDNGNFELATADPAWPDGWIKAKGISWGSETKHFLHLVQQQPGAMLMAYREMAIPAGVKYLEVSIRYRTSGVVAGAQNWNDARAMFHFIDASRKVLSPEPGALIFSNDTADWTVVSGQFAVPDGATGLMLFPSLCQVKAGTLDLAEVRVTALDDTAAAKKEEAVAARAKKAVDQAAMIDKELALPAKSPELKVSGNKLVTADGKEVWLQGVNVVRMGWSANGEGTTLWAIHVAIDDWHANVIRLPVMDNLWFGQGSHGAPPNDPEAYRALVDRAIKLAAARGAYIVLDLHRFLTPDESCVAFWKDAAARYKNNPAVLFDLFNEPHGTTWEVWQKGGPVDVKQKDGTTQTVQGVGMQALIDAVRGTGAHNIVVAGGLGYSYDLSGVEKGFALDDKGGNGIMYATHFYNWHKGWAEHFMGVAAKYPVLVGETGGDVGKMTFIPLADQEDPYTWAPDAIGFFQKNHLNWTGWCFDTGANPAMLLDMDKCTPNPYWGQFVKDALGGKQFEMVKER